jgi:glycosyltransferase involved in cell wall biosynthesis
MEILEEKQKVGKKFLHRIDTSACWDLKTAENLISGWCLGLDGIEVRKIRVRIGAETFERDCRLSRPDVAAAYSAIARDDRCGFAVPVCLRQGQQSLSLEGIDQKGRTYRLCEHRATAPLAPLRAHIDTPQTRSHPAGRVRFSGWCFHQDFSIVHLILSFNGFRANCHHSIDRPDVQAAFPQWGNSLRSGFEVVLPLPPSQGSVTLEATLENGETVCFLSEAPFNMLSPLFWGRIAGVRSEVENFFNFGMEKARQWRQKRGRWPSLRELLPLCRRAWLLYRDPKRKKREVSQGLAAYLPPAPEDPYQAWLAVNMWNPRAEENLRSHIAGTSGHLAKVSILMPVYNPPLTFLSRAIQSVFEQVYPNWELCIADDASTDPEVHRLIRMWAQRDSRVRVIFRQESGKISCATNSAANLATGDFFLFLDHDDELSPDALGEIALYLQDHPDTDFLYSDDDKIDSQGRRFAPQFKPDWSPELLLSYMYCSHLVVVRKALFEGLGGMRMGFEGSQDYDFALRATERARHVAHLPLLLYHWRVLPGSTAESGVVKPDSIEAGRRAVQEALERRDIQGTVYQPEWAVKGKVGIFYHEFPDDGPSVAIIISTKNQLQALRTCIESLRCTTYRNYKILIVDNESDEPETIEYFKGCVHRVARIPSPKGILNLAHLNNRAVEQVDAEFVLFLNNNTEVREPKWLSRMMGYAQIPGVGVIGARLLLPDGRVLHAGVVHGFYHGLAGPAFKLAPSWDHGYLSYAMVTRNYSAVTAACMLTRRKLFCSVGGFDEELFPIAYNAVDYCYRLVDRGYRCVYVPGAELTHYEGFSRGFNDRPAEEAAFRQEYGKRIDPWYSPHLSLANERFNIIPRRVVRPGNRPVKTFMVVFNLNLEGAPYSHYEMTARLRKDGIIDPIVYCPEEGPLKGLYEEAGIPVQIGSHPLKGVLTGTDYENAIDQFAGSLKKTGAEVVFGNTLQTFYAIAAAKTAGIPSIWNVHESEPWETYFDHFGSEIAGRALDCFVYPYRVVFVANATRGVYTPLNSRRNFMVVHNGLNLTRLEKEANRWSRTLARSELGIGEKEISLLLLGTVCERKGQHDLVRAFPRIDRRFHAMFQCFIVGDRPSGYSRALWALWDALPRNLKDRTHIIPESEDTALYYRAADIFICTSRVESFPRVILEAMAYGLPIITTPVYGIREQVRPGVNGLFYEPGNEGQLASAIEELLSNPDQRARFAENSKLVLATLTTFDEMIEQYALAIREASLIGPFQEIR